MKAKLVGTALFVLTTAAVAYPALRSNGPINATPIVTAPLQPVLPVNRPVIDVVFVLDTTGSMSGLIDAAKEKIWSIASSMASAQPAPIIRMGLVGYRDRGDEYVTRVVDLSPDIDTMYATLMQFTANGGGDGPESVNQALSEAVTRMSWSSEGNAYKVIFLVGDAPPHMDYPDDVKYPQSLAVAAEKGIVVNTIQCGNATDAKQPWQQIASIGHGSYFNVDQAGSAVAIATPFDAELARLSAALDDTRLYYGTKEEKARTRAKVEATDALHALASPASQARRAAFNASDAGVINAIGETRTGRRCSERPRRSRESRSGQTARTVAGAIGRRAQKAGHRERREAQRTATADQATRRPTRRLRRGADRGGRRRQRLARRQDLRRRARTGGKERTELPRRRSEVLTRQELLRRRPGPLRLRSVSPRASVCRFDPAAPPHRLRPLRCGVRR